MGTLMNTCVNHDEILPNSPWKEKNLPTQFVDKENNRIYIQYYIF
jgi:hypothetical protein